jgi:hypothetical protein
VVRGAAGGRSRAGAILAGNHGAQQTITYDYLRRELAPQKQARDEMAKDFVWIIKEEGQ